MSSVPISPGGRSPLGTRINNPSSDGGTMALTRNQPNVPQGAGALNAFREDAYVASGAWVFRGMRDALALVRGDKQGCQLMDLWMSGTAPDQVTFDTEEWGDYMRSEPDLQKQIEDRLQADAYGLRERIDSSTGRLADRYESSFHGQVGNKSPLGMKITGGFFTGYEILHGSNSSVGDVQISGKWTAVRSGPAGSAYTVTFDGLAFIWNDIIDPNPKAGDTVFANYARAENHFTGNPAPRDYTIHIKWKAKQPTTLKVAAKGDVPPDLKMFPDR